MSFSWLFHNLFTVNVRTLPLASLVFETTTSLVALKEPVTTVVSPTFRVIVPAVPLNLLNFADIEVMVCSAGSVVVNAIDVAGTLLDPT